MATPITGNKLGVYVDHDNASAGTTSPRLLALGTSCSLSFSNSTIETASKKANVAGTQLDTGTSLTHAMAGSSSWTITAEGLLDLTDPAANADEDGAGTAEHGFQNLMAIALNRSKIGVYFVDASNATAGGGPGYTGTAFIESIEASGGVDDFATYSVTFKGDGDLTLV